MFKKAITIILALTILLGVGGCMKQKVTKKYTIKEKKELVLEYLKNRYGEEFEGISFSSAELMKGYDEFYVYPKSKTKEDAFLVTGSYHKYDGQYVIRDGYLGIVLQPELEKIMEGIVRDIYEEFWIAVTAIGGSSYSARDTVEEIMQMDGYVDITLDVYIDVKESSAQKTNLEDVLQEIAQKMKDKKLKGGIWIWVVKDEKYDYLKDNIGKIEIEPREYYVYPEDKAYPEYTARVFENIETGKLEISNNGGDLK